MGKYEKRCTEKAVEIHVKIIINRKEAILIDIYMEKNLLRSINDFKTFDEKFRGLMND